MHSSATLDLLVAQRGVVHAKMTTWVIAKEIDVQLCWRRWKCDGQLICSNSHVAPGIPIWDKRSKS